MKNYLLPRTLTLVRHGQSEGNIIKLDQNARKEYSRGALSPPLHTLYFRLTEKGIAQSKQAGEWLKNHFVKEALRRIETPYAHLKGFISPYYRTRETAGYLDLAIDWTVDHRLSERNWGALELMTSEERYEKVGNAIYSYHKHGLYWQVAGVETLQSVSARAADHIRDLKEYAGADVVQVSHGEFMFVERFLLEGWLPEELSEMMQRTSLSAPSTDETDWQNKMINTRIIQYTREREDGSWADSYVRVRMIDPVNPTSSILSTDWIPLAERTFSNEELLKSVEAAPHMLR